MAAFLRQTWLDPRLAYNASLLPPGAAHVRLDAEDEIWKPDTYFYNQIGDPGTLPYEASTPGTGTDIERVSPILYLILSHSLSPSLSLLFLFLSLCISY